VFWWVVTRVLLKAVNECIDGVGCGGASKGSNGREIHRFDSTERGGTTGGAVSWLRVKSMTGGVFEIGIDVWFCGGETVSPPPSDFVVAGSDVTVGDLPIAAVACGGAVVQWISVCVRIESE